MACFEPVFDDRMACLKGQSKTKRFRIRDQTRYPANVQSGVPAQASRDQGHNSIAINAETMKSYSEQGLSKAFQNVYHAILSKREYQKYRLTV
jgi:hypothetical protein